ncbi:MAG TPA: hypothetical protein VMF91_24700 [Bryobacteraceae bacterium]|nr:hypothetical protein [Bryobacteraceae bacterium]
MRPKDELVVVHDESLELFLPSFLAAIHDYDIATAFIHLPRVQQIALMGDGIKSEHIRFPKGILDATRQATTILIILDADTATTKLRHEILRCVTTDHSRVGHLPGISNELLSSISDYDTKQINQAAARIESILGRAAHLEVITYSAAGARSELQFGLLPPNKVFTSSMNIAVGAWANARLGKVSIPVSPRKVSGSLCISGSAPGLVVNAAEELEVFVDSGRLSKASHNRSGRLSYYLGEIAHRAEIIHDNQWNLVCQFSIGLNARIRKLSGDISRDSCAQGAISFGIGNNVTMGGEIDSSIRTDFTILRSTVRVDGVEVITDGRLSLPLDTRRCT